MNRRGMIRCGLLVALCAALLVLATACGGGGGGGGGGGPVSPPSGISFTASGGATSNGLVLTPAAGSTPTQLRLDLRAQEVVSLYGVAFDLVYPNQILSFNVVSEGAFLAGTSTSLQVEESSPGRLVIGLSRLGDAPGASGTGVVLTLEFASRATAGTGSLTFERNAAFGPTGAAISGVAWGGGSVSVTP